MPNVLFDPDVGFPRLEAYAATEDKLAAIQNYLFLLLENLRYTLRNLSMEENFNASELSTWVDGLDIKADTVVSNTVITNELYAGYGAVADLAVDEVRTDYMRAARYLVGNTNDLNYIHVHDEEITFYNARVTDPVGAEQLHHGSRFFWWRDDTHQEMTSLEDTGLPVMVFTYDEAPKAKIHFGTGTDREGVEWKLPVIDLGEGTDTAGNGTGRLVKHAQGMELTYRTKHGQRIGLSMGDDGYADVQGLRRTTRLDLSGFSTGVIRETVDGGATEEYAVTFDAEGRPATLTDGSGHVTEVVW